MQKSKMILLLLLTISVLPGCRWQDDFRDRRQPQILEPERRPTLNVDSIDYEGNPLREQAEEEQNTCLPTIDGLSEIPEVPDHPCSM